MSNKPLRTFSSIHNLTTGETIRMDELPPEKQEQVKRDITKRFIEAAYKTQGVRVEVTFPDDHK